MILNAYTIDKATKIKVLAIHFLLLATSAALAQNYGQQLDDYIALSNHVIEDLQRQLDFAIKVCFLMGGLTLLTILFFVFDHKINNWIFNALLWWNEKKIWLKNKRRF